MVVPVMVSPLRVHLLVLPTPGHQIQSRGSCVLHPIDNSMGSGEGRASTWGQGCPRGGDRQNPAAGAGAEPEHPLLPHLDAKPPRGPGV